MFPDLDDISTSNVHDRASNALGRVDNDVVVLRHVELVQ